VIDAATTPRSITQARHRSAALPGGINDRGWIVGEYFDYLNADTTSSGLRRSALDAERPLGPLDGLRLGR